MLSGKIINREVKKNRDGTKNVLLLQVEITDPEDIQTVELMSQTGEENNPPSNSKATMVQVGDAWKIAVSTDDQIEPITDPGEKRLYSTNTEGDTVLAEQRFYNDGKIIISNNEVTITAFSNGLTTIHTSGNLEITSAKTIINNDVEIDGGDLELTNGIIKGANVYNGATSNGHIHPQGSDSAGDAEQDTGVAK